MQTRAEAATLIEVIFPRAGLLQDIAFIVGFSVVTAIAAQLSIALPFTPVPITGQTFAVLLTGMLLGSRRGALSMLTYLVEGAMGMPVFAGGTGGLARLAGPTGGYLIGFVAAAFVIGLLAERGWDRRVPTALCAMAVGNAVVYLPGLTWLAIYTSWKDAMPLGLYPFILGDVLKMVLAAVVLPLGWRLANFGSKKMR